jgi:L-rhamnose mutarotase
MNRRFCLTLDLKNDPALIAEYKRYHQKIWPEITRSIRDFGVEDMEIYLLGTRMFMIMEVNEHFSFEAKARADRDNPKVQEWENLMWKFQQALPEAKPCEKWLQMCGSPIRMDSPGHILGSSEPSCTARTDKNRQR